MKNTLLYAVEKKTLQRKSGIGLKNKVSEGLFIAISFL